MSPSKLLQCICAVTHATMKTTLHPFNFSVRFVTWPASLFVRCVGALKILMTARLMRRLSHKGTRNKESQEIEWLLKYRVRDRRTRSQNVLSCILFKPFLKPWFLLINYFTKSRQFAKSTLFLKWVMLVLVRKSSFNTFHNFGSIKVWKKKCFSSIRGSIRMG